MGNLWNIITDNSTLPIQAGNNLWDHLNNQAGGGGDITLLEVSAIDVEIDDSPFVVEIIEQEYTVILEDED